MLAIKIQSFRSNRVIRVPFSMASILALVLAAVGTAAADPGTISEITGRVEIGRGSPPAFTRARAGDRVKPGESVRTGAQARAELRVGAGTVRLYANSLLRIPADPDAGYQLEMKRGRSIFDVIKESVRDRFEVRTPEVVVSVKGTRFEVDLEGKLAEIAVFRGTVGVRPPDADRELETLVREGFAAIGASHVPFDLDLTPRVDPWETWKDLSSPRDTAMQRDRADHRVELREAARSDARRSSARELVEIAAKRNPELARKIKKERAARLSENHGKHARGGEERSDTGPAAAAYLGDDERLPGLERVSRDKFKRDHERMENDRSEDSDSHKMLEKINSSRADLLRVRSLSNESSDSGHLKVSEDPSKSLRTGNWDPTPTLTVMEAVSLKTDMSYQEIIDGWYRAVEELKISRPSVFSNSDPKAYEDALRLKLVEIGLSNDEAKSISDFVVDKIGK